MSMVRTFIGVEIAEEVRETLAVTIQRLRSAGPRAKWVAAGNLHLTLKFLGDVAPSELEDIFAAAQLVAQEAEGFDLDIRGLGCFPNERYPRVIWAGCGEGAEALSSLVRGLEEVCADLGYEREKRPFSPHLTLGRVHDPRDGCDLAPVLADLGAPEFGVTGVYEIVVFMSELRKCGPVYSPMYRAALGEA